MPVKHRVCVPVNGRIGEVTINDYVFGKIIINVECGLPEVFFFG